MTSSPKWKSFDLAEAQAARAESGGLWREFLRVPDMYAGIYEIPAGAKDPQSPHDHDELYHVVRGVATFVVGDESVPVRAGSILYVAKDVEHRFVDIEEDLSILVLFATTG